MKSSPGGETKARQQEGARLSRQTPGASHRGSGAPGLPLNRVTTRGGQEEKGRAAGACLPAPGRPSESLIKNSGANDRKPAPASLALFPKDRAEERWAGPDTRTR